jgi:hypothetical protein
MLESWRQFFFGTFCPTTNRPKKDASFESGTRRVIQKPKTDRHNTHGKKDTKINLNKSYQRIFRMVKITVQYHWGLVSKLFISP